MLVQEVMSDLEMLWLVLKRDKTDITRILVLFLYLSCKVMLQTNILAQTRGLIQVEQNTQVVVFLVVQIAELFFESLPPPLVILAYHSCFETIVTTL